MENAQEEKSINFIEEIIKGHLEEGRYSKIVTRFPPEPNGYLHIGHASSICLNFGLTQTFPGYTNLRFDDTNPVTEETEFVNSIKEDIAWLGFQWENELYASDYFDQLYEYALQLILQGDAYVDDLSSEEIAQQKGNIGIPGIHSPYRSRSVEENLDLFKRMRAGEFADGSKTLRAKIAMDSPNLIMRDPVLYRIKKAHHHRTGDQWCIYPMYDFAHGQSDSIEEVTHSICTMEFIPHRELYDWLIQKLGIYPSKQYEFARRNVTYTVTSKRKLLQLVKDKHVAGWDDPRMPTLSGMRRRGYPPSSIRDFCERIGIGKRDNRVDIGLLEFCVREELNRTAPRVMAVMNPLKVKITNLPEDHLEWLDAENSPEDSSLGSRKVPFSNTLWIEADDFMENPPKKYFRLFPQGAVRLKNAYIVQCDAVVYKEDGYTIDYLACSIIPNSKSGEDSSGMKVKGTIHWVSTAHAKKVEVRSYDRLFTVENPLEDKEKDFLEFLNPESLVVFPEVFIEPNFGRPSPYQPYQFLRLGYFSVDPDSKEEAIVFNKVVGLKDSWAKINTKA